MALAAPPADEPPPSPIADPAARFAEAERYMEIGAMREAEPLYRALVELPQFSRRREAMTRLGEIYLTLEMTEELDRHAERAVKEYPNEANAQAARAASLALAAGRASGWHRQLRLANAALDHAGRAVAIDPDCALARFVRGMIWLHMPPLFGRLADAAAEFEAVLASRDPFRDRFLHDAYYRLAQAYRRLRQDGRSLETLRAARLRFPSSPALLELETLYLRKKE